jgi:hypothetical protein
MLAVVVGVGLSGDYTVGLWNVTDPAHPKRPGPTPDRAAASSSSPRWRSALAGTPWSTPITQPNLGCPPFALSHTRLETP